MTHDNPFGMDPDDPLGRDDILVYNPEVHLPVNVPVKVNLRSKDVLHDFAVAQFRVKMDLVPGMETYLWFEPTVTGTYEVLCEELCGIAHHTMRGAVVVDEQADFDAWVARNRHSPKRRVAVLATRRSVRHSTRYALRVMASRAKACRH